MGCVMCMLFKSLYHRYNMHIINRIAEDDREYGTYEEEDDDDDGYEEDDEEEEEEYDAKERRGFLSSVTDFLTRRSEETEDDEENDTGVDEEDKESDYDDQEKPSGPKFRVIKK